MPAFSHSRIGAYENCPLQYKFRYIDKVKVEVEATVEAFLGDVVHRALEKLYSNIRYEEMWSLEDLLDYYLKTWKEEWSESIVIVKKDFEQDNYRRMGERYLREYYARHHPFDEGKILGLETQNYLRLDEDGRYSFHIRIDRLMDRGEGVYEVHDYKTSQSLPDQEELDKDRQLAMYSLWVRQRFKDFKKVRLVWHFLAFDKEMDSYRTADELEKLKSEVLDKIKKIETAKEFPANVTRLCDWCLFRGICPMWKHEAGLEEKPENEYLNDAGVKLVDDYARVKNDLDLHKAEAEAELEKLKEALVQFSRSEGISVVTGTEYRITVKQEESFKFPGKTQTSRNKLVEVLQGLGKLSEVLSLDTRALARVLEAKTWNEDELSKLESFVTREKTYKFSLSKK